MGHLTHGITTTVLECDSRHDIFRPGFLYGVIQVVLAYAHLVLSKGKSDEEHEDDGDNKSQKHRTDNGPRQFSLASVFFTTMM